MQEFSLFMVVLCLAVLLVVLLWYLFPILDINGRSMYPTYRDGEKSLATRLVLKKHLKPGQVIIYQAPQEDLGKRIIVIKRIKEVRIVQSPFNHKKSVVEYFCVGDNLDESYDSRYYGYISSEAVIGIVLHQRQKINIEEVRTDNYGEEENSAVDD